MTPAELTAIEARHVEAVVGLLSYPQRECATDEQPWPCDASQLAAALRTEQEARARVEAAARAVVAEWDEMAANWRGEAFAISRGQMDLRAALAPDASEGETE